jgi:hypothetical protein
MTKRLKPLPNQLVPWRRIFLEHYLVNKLISSAQLERELTSSLEPTTSLHHGSLEFSPPPHILVH